MLASLFPAARNSEYARVDPPPPSELLARIRALPSAGPLMRRLPEHPGVYLVGGAVRDLLLGGAPFDLDLVVDGDAGEVAALLDGEVVIHDRFGTATVRVCGITYDLARARRETYSRPGALPEVAPASLEEDLRRRDFTVNAIAIALAGPDAGELNLVPGALEDLDARLLRVLHKRSFLDDPTRMLRLARYRSRLGFELESGTRELLHDAVRERALSTVSGPRIGAELRLLAREPDPVQAMRSLRELRLDRAIHPAFGLDDPELARKALALLPEDGRADRLVLALAGQHLPADDLGRVLDELAFDAADRDAIVAAATRADAVAAALSEARRPSEIASVASGASPELVAIAGALGPEGPARAWLSGLRDVRLEIDGRDLLERGISRGPAVGRGLRAALAAKLDGKARGRDDELAIALEAARDPG